MPNIEFEKETFIIELTKALPVFSFNKGEFIPIFQNNKKEIALRRRCKTQNFATSSFL